MCGQSIAEFRLPRLVHRKRYDDSIGIDEGRHLAYVVDCLLFLLASTAYLGIGGYTQQVMLQCQCCVDHPGGFERTSLLQRLLLSQCHVLV